MVHSVYGMVHSSSTLLNIALQYGTIPNGYRSTFENVNIKNFIAFKSRVCVSSALSCGELILAIQSYLPKTWVFSVKRYIPRVSIVLLVRV